MNKTIVRNTICCPPCIKTACIDTRGVEHVLWNWLWSKQTLMLPDHWCALNIWIWLSWQCCVSPLYWFGVVYMQWPPPPIVCPSYSSGLTWKISGHFLIFSSLVSSFGNGHIFLIFSFSSFNPSGRQASKVNVCQTFNTCILKNGIISSPNISFLNSVPLNVN